jgi:hypothetical protein
MAACDVIKRVRFPSIRCDGEEKRVHEARFLV